MSFKKEASEFLDYHELAKAFQEKPEEFAKMLRMVHEDFITKQMLMIDAVMDNNLGSFKNIYNDLRGNINLFKIKTFEELMDRIEKYLTIPDKESSDKIIITELHQKFNLIFQSLENKIKELAKISKA